MTTILSLEICTRSQFTKTRFSNSEKNRLPNFPHGCIPNCPIIKEISIVSASSNANITKQRHPFPPIKLYSAMLRSRSCSARRSHNRQSQSPRRRCNGNTNVWQGPRFKLAEVIDCRQSRWGTYALRIFVHVLTGYGTTVVGRW